MFTLASYLEPLKAFPSCHLYPTKYFDVSSFYNRRFNLLFRSTAIPFRKFLIVFFDLKAVDQVLLRTFELNRQLTRIH